MGTSLKPEDFAPAQAGLTDEFEPPATGLAQEDFLPPTEKPDTARTQPTPTGDPLAVKALLEKIHADKSTRVATLQGILGRPDISPAQRQRVQRLLDMEKENFFTNAREEDRADAENFFRGVADAAVRFGTVGAADLAVGIAQLPFKALSAMFSQDLDPLEGLRETTRTGMEAAKLLTDPEGKAGLAGQVTGVLGSALLGGNPFAASTRIGAAGKAVLSPWAVLNSAGMRAVAARSPAAARVIEAGTREGATYGQRVLAQLVGNGAIDALAATDIATGPGDLDEKMRALLTQGGLSLAAGFGAAIPKPRPRPALPAPEPKPTEAVAPTIEEAREAVAGATETLTKARRGRAAKVAQSWNEMTPEQRKQIVPGLSDEEYGMKYGKLPVKQKTAARTAIEELMPSEVDPSTQNAEATRLRDENDKLRAKWAASVAKRRAEAKAARAEHRVLKQELAVDPLTGLSSPRALIGLKQRNPQGVWGVFDVASLKAMNDANGHEAGDQVLIRAAIAIKGAAEENGVEVRDVFRAGDRGDEFVLLGQSKEQIDKIIARAAELYGDEPVPNTTKRTRLYGAAGATPEEADAAIKAMRSSEAREYRRATREEPAPAPSPVTKLSQGEPTPEPTVKPQAAPTPEPAPQAEPPARTIAGSPEEPPIATPPKPSGETRASEASTQKRIAAEKIVESITPAGQRQNEVVAKIAAQEPAGMLEVRKKWSDVYVANGKRARESADRAWRGLSAEQKADVQRAVAEGDPLPHIPPLRGQAAKPAAKPVDPYVQLEKIEDALDRKLDAGEITDEQYGRLWSQQVGEPRALLRKAGILEEARDGSEAAADITPMEVAESDAAMARRYPELSMDEATLRQIQKVGETIGGVEGMAQVRAAKQAMRFNKAVNSFDNEKLHTHGTELQSMMQEATDVERELIKARYAEVQAEIKRRSSPNPIELMNNERGSIMARPEHRGVFEKGTDVPDYQKSTREKWVKGHGLNTFRAAVEDALANPAQSWADMMYNLRRKLQNSNLPLREIGNLIAGGEKLEAFKNPYAWAQMFSGWATRADTFLFGRPFTWDDLGNPVELNAKALRSVIQEVGSSYDDFVDYLLAARELETGRVGIPKADAERIVANAPVKFAGWARDVAMYSDALLKYATDAGLVSGKTLTLLTELYKNYVPIHRIVEGEAVASPMQRIVGPRAISTRRLGPGKAIYRLTGSKDKMIDPIQAIVENTRRLIRDADMNRVSRTLLDAAEAEPAKFAGLVEIVKDEKHRLSPRNQKLFEEFKDQIKEAHPAADDQAIAALFDAVNRERLGRKNDILVAYRNGRRYKMRVRTDIAEAFGAMSPKHMEWYVRLMAAPTRLLKGGVVLQPLFSPLAFFKDIFEATARSKYGFKPWDSFTGLGIALTESPIAKMLGISQHQYLREFRIGGGAFTALSGTEARTTKAAYSYVTKGLGAKGTLLHPIDALKRWARPFEEAARLGEFRRARMQGASVLESSIAARNVTIDFTQAGTTMQALNVIFPFLNPAIQSLTGDMSAIRRQPSRVLAVGTGLALGSLLLAAANADDQEINDLRKTPYGSLFWWFRLPNGEIGKMPKPYFFGQLFATGAERAWDEMVSKDPNAGQRWIDAVREQVSYTSMPALAQWGIALYANKLPFTGSPIESDEMQDLLPMYRVTPRTSAAAKGISDVANAILEKSPLSETTKDRLQISPIRVDAMLGLAVGSLGRDVRGGLNYLSAVRDEAPEAVAADLPVVGRLFGRYPSHNTEPVYYFYERAEHTQQVTSTAAMLAEHRPEEYGAFIEANTKDYIMAGIHAGTRRSMADVRSSIEAIESMEGLDPKSKREMIDEQMRIIIELARISNQIDQSIPEMGSTSR